MTEPTRTFSIRAKKDVIADLDREAVRKGLTRNQVILSRIARRPWYKRLWAFVFKPNT